MTNPELPQPTKKNDWGKSLLTALVLFAIVGGCSLLLGRNDDKPSEDAVRRDVDRVCEGFVKERLKAPAGAEFGDPNITATAGTYTVVNTVDAENSFGAKLRLNYTCQVHDSADGKNWVLDSLTGLD